MCVCARARVTYVCVRKRERERERERAGDTRMQRGVTISSGGPHGMHRAESKTTQSGTGRTEARRGGKERIETAMRKMVRRHSDYRVQVSTRTLGADDSVRSTEDCETRPGLAGEIGATRCRNKHRAILNR